MALRQMARVPPATRKRVEEAAARIGYIRDPEIGPVLARSRSKAPQVRETIALFLEVDIDNATRNGRPWLATIHREALFAAHLLGCEVEPVRAAPGDNLKRLGDRLWRRGIRGILVGPYTAGPCVRLEMDWSRFAAVELGMTLETPLLNRIERSYVEDLPQLYHTLHARGFRRIGLALSGPRRAYLHHLPEALLLLFCKQVPEQIKVSPLAPQSYHPRGFLEWVAAERPDAVIVYEQEPVSWLESVSEPHPKLIFLDAPGPGQWGMEADISLMVRDAIRLLLAMIHSGEWGEPERCRSHAYRHLFRLPTD